MEQHIDQTKVFPAQDLVKITIHPEDPDREPNWRTDIQSDAAYEGAAYFAKSQNQDDEWTILIPKSDLRKWEQAATANGTDIVVNRELLQGSFALPKIEDSTNSPV